MSELILFRKIINIIRDICFTYIYTRSIKSQNQSLYKKYIGIIFLLLTLLMYSAEDGGVFSYALIRLIFRGFCYFIYIKFSKDIPTSLACYYALFIDVICTISHNLFLTPITRPIILCEFVFVGNIYINFIICLLIVNIFEIFFYFLVYKFIPLYTIKEINSIRIMILLTICLFSLYLNNTLRFITDTNMAQQTELSIYSILLQLSLFACLIFMELFQRKTEESLQMKIEKISTETLLNNIKEQQKNNELIRQIRHDLKNHFVTLRFLISQDSSKKAIHYIDHIIGEYTDKQININTGNKIIDGLLIQKLNITKENNIDFSLSTDFSHISPIVDVDLCIILGNIIDNAIEANMKINNEDRFINLRAGISYNQFIITIENAFDGHIQFHKELPLTSKQDKEIHGIGLKSTKRIINKYNGILTIKNHNNKFILTIMIPL